MEPGLEGPSVTEVLEGADASASVVAASAWLSTKWRWESGRACLEPVRDLELARDLEEFWTPIRRYGRVGSGRLAVGPSALAVETSAW